MVKTLVIMGAGASRSHGLLCGPELRNWILTYPGALTELLTLNVHQSDATGREIIGTRVARFIQQFRTATTDTIDEFLEFQPAFRHEARLAITRCLLEKEASVIQAGNFTDGCYRYIGDKLSREAPEKWLEDLQLVTFNYERCLEYTVAAMQLARSAPDRARALLDRMLTRVHHVYGSFSMKYSIREAGFVVANAPKGQQVPPEEFVESSRGIRVIGEDRATGIEPLRIALKGFNRLIFLGFAFHNTNLELLGLSDGSQALNDGCQVYATAMNLSDRRRRELAALFPGIVLGKRDETCAAFVQEHELFA